MSKRKLYNLKSVLTDPTDRSWLPTTPQ